MSLPKGLPTEHDPVYLVDGNNILFRAFHALPMLTAPDGTPINAVHGFARMVHALRRDVRPSHLAVAFDAKGPTFRNEIYPEYKANRSEPPEELVPQFGLVRQAVDALSIPRLELDGCEADDLIATLTAQAQAAGHPVVIVSSDKDLMQLVRGGERPVVLLDTMKQKVIGPEEVVAKFGVGPDKLGDLLALAGDSSDNIPGVPGIGPKTAATLLGQFGDLETTLASTEQVRQKKRRERLETHAEDARMSRRLVALRADCPVPSMDQIRDPGLDPARAIEFFKALGFRTFLRELEREGAAAGADAAAPETEGEAAWEVLPARHPFTPPDEPVAVVEGADAAAMDDLVAKLAECGQVAAQVMWDGTDPMLATPVGVALAGRREGGPLLAYVDLGAGGESVQAEDAHGVPPRVREALSHLDPVWSDAARCTADGHKTQAVVLEECGARVGRFGFDTLLASYVLDPARASHQVDALAQDLFGHTLPTREALVGKGRKARPLREIPPPQVAAFAGERAACVLAASRELAEQIERAGEAARKLLAQVELPLAAVLRAMERRGVCLDGAVLEDQSRALAHIIEKIRAEVAAEAGYEINLDSPIQLRKLLFDERGLPPVRKTKTGYSTDARVLEELSVLDPIVGQILEYRSLNKLKGTYLDTLPRLINARTGRLHTQFHQAVAQTGRLSSSDPNLQNIPVRTEFGRRIREAFVAPEGHLLVSLDYSQIELRILAHLSGDPNLLSAFREGADVHRRTAAEVFDVDEGQVTDDQRRIAKAVNFGVIYGQTAFGLARQLQIPRGKAGLYIRRYFEKIPGVQQYMEELVSQARERGYAETILGRRRRIPELARKGAARAHGERMARNTPIQGSAADILKLAMIRVEAALAEASLGRMVLTVHDELIFECPEGKVQDLVDRVRPIMEGVIELNVPLKVDVGSGPTWAACKG